MSARRGPGFSDQALAAIASARRAAAAERVSASSVAVELRPLASLGEVIEAWTALATRALEPNVFLDPVFALAAAPVFGADVQAGLVWSQTSPPELLGLFPVRIERRRYGLSPPVLRSWTHPYAPMGTPLVHRDVAEPALTAWLDHATDNPTLPGLLLMPYMRDDGAFANVFDAVVARRRSAVASFGRHQRAMLAPEDGRADYLGHALARRRRKELSRQWRRLQDFGPAAISCAETLAAVATALEDFFQLEASGWKGRLGTAVAGNPEIRQFVTHSVIDLAAQRRAALYRLCVGDRPIAACITLRSGPSAWLWKIAYDEAYARFSPGAQLMVRVTEALLRDATIAQVDSLATPNHPMIDHIWRERCTISDRLILLKTDSLVPFSFVCHLETLRRLGRSTARAVLEHMRGH